MKSSNKAIYGYRLPARPTRSCRTAIVQLGLSVWWPELVSRGRAAWRFESLPRLVRAPRSPFMLLLPFPIVICNRRQP